MMVPISGKMTISTTQSALAAEPRSLRRTASTIAAIDTITTCNMNSHSRNTAIRSPSVRGHGAARSQLDPVPHDRPVRAVELVVADRAVPTPAGLLVETTAQVVRLEHPERRPREPGGAESVHRDVVERPARARPLDVLQEVDRAQFAGVGRRSLVARRT